MKRVQIGSVAATAAKLALAAVVTLAAALPAAAADMPAPAAARTSYLSPTPTSDWIVTIGIEARVLPKFEGASSSMLRPFPILRVRKADEPDQFRSARDGLSFAILDAGAFKLGPVAKLRFGRKESDDNNLRGLGDVNWAFEAGAFAEYGPAHWLRTRAEVRQGFGGHDGPAKFRDPQGECSTITVRPTPWLFADRGRASCKRERGLGGHRQGAQRQHKRTRYHRNGLELECLRATDEATSPH